MCGKGGNGVRPYDILHLFDGREYIHMISNECLPAESIARVSTTVNRNCDRPTPDNTKENHQSAMYTDDRSTRQSSATPVVLLYFAPVGHPV